MDIRLIRSLAKAVFAGTMAVVVVSGPVLATQYDPPWADAMWAHWPEVNALDTHGTMNIAKTELGYGGYHSFSTSPVTIASAMGSSYAQSDAIWWMAGHANAGIITLYSTTYGSMVLSASGNAATCNSPHDCLTDHTFAQMHDIKLMVFHGCDTGKVGGTGLSLPGYAKQNLGVGASLGFTDLVSFSADTSDVWADYFAYYGRMGWSVTNAAFYAANAVHSAYGSYAGYDKTSIWGGGQFIYPAAYGS